MSCLTLSQTDLPRRMLAPASQSNEQYSAEAPRSRKPRQVCKRLRTSTLDVWPVGPLWDQRSIPFLRSLPAWGEHFLLVEGHFLVGGVLETLFCPSLCSTSPALSFVIPTLFLQDVPSVLAAIFLCPPNSKGEECSWASRPTREKDWACP